MFSLTRAMSLAKLEGTGGEGQGGERNGGKGSKAQGQQENEPCNFQHKTSYESHPLGRVPSFLGSWIPDLSMSSQTMRTCSGPGDDPAGREVTGLSNMSS